jgi:hypothetical protein
VDGKNADVIGSEAPYSKRTTEGSNTRVCALRVLHEHAISSEDILLLTISLGLEVSDAAREEVDIHDFTLAPAEFSFLFQLLLLEGKPISDLLAAEGDLTSTIADIEDRRRVLGMNFASDGECTTTRGRDGTTGFVTRRQSVRGFR